MLPVADGLVCAGRTRAGDSIRLHCGCCTWNADTAAFSFSSRALSFDARQYRTLVFMALALVTYGIGISAVNSWFDFFEQSATRPYYVVGGLMGTMILSAYFSHQNICEDPFAVTRLRAVVICILVHIFMIAGLQSVYGPMFGASPQGAAAIVQLDQVMNPGERGLGRLRGPFLSPNTLAMVPLMYMLMLLRTRRSGTIPVSFIVGFFCAGISAAALGGARTMFVFYLAATAAMAWTRSPGKTLGVAVMAAPLLLLVRIPWDEILVIMRLNNLQSLGVRGRMWQVCVDSTSQFEWLFGVGLAHFPVLFGRLLGITVSDPHNWILSVGGMFGCFGLLFYMFMAARLLQRTVSSDKIEQVIAVSLVLFLLCRDLANTQYVLNNHPLCCLYWMSIGFAFTGPVKRISGASALPGRE
jgi:hypothetical protein